MSIYFMIIVYFFLTFSIPCFIIAIDAIRGQNPLRPVPFRCQHRERTGHRKGVTVSMAVTLKDVAAALGITATTVHKALHGKDGVNAKTREQILRTAAEMGYRPNYMAASLKRKEACFAIALPTPVEEARYYYDNLWRGARQFLSEIPPFEPKILEFPYQNVPGMNGRILREIYEKWGDQLDGVLTIADSDSASSYFLEKLSEAGVHIVFLGSDMYREKRLCCVKTYDETVGRLAAELICAFNPSGTPLRVVAAGHFGLLALNDQQLNIAGFESYLKEKAPQIQVIRIQGSSSEEVALKLHAELEANPHTFAVYSSSARTTVAAARVAEDLRLDGKLRIIGNDCFSESLQLLRKGTLTAIIDKKVSRQAYLGMKALFDRTIKNEYPSGSIVYVNPEVVLQSTLDHYEFPIGKDDQQ